MSIKGEKVVTVYFINSVSPLEEEEKNHGVNAHKLDSLFLLFLFLQSVCVAKAHSSVLSSYP